MIGLVIQGHVIINISSESRKNIRFAMGIAWRNVRIGLLNALRKATNQNRERTGESRSPRGVVGATGQTFNLPDSSRRG